MRDTVVGSSGKYHLPQSLSVRGAELPYQAPTPSLEFELEVHICLTSGTLIFGLCCSEPNPVLIHRDLLCMDFEALEESERLFSHPLDLE